MLPIPSLGWTIIGWIATVVTRGLECVQPKNAKPQGLKPQMWWEICEDPEELGYWWELRSNMSQFYDTADDLIQLIDERKSIERNSYLTEEEHQ